MLIGIYVLGVPLGLLYVLRKRKRAGRLDDDDVKLTLGSLYMRYERKYYCPSRFCRGLFSIGRSAFHKL